MGMLRQSSPSLNDVLMSGGEGPPPTMQTSTDTPVGVDPSLYDQAFAPNNLGPRPDTKRSGLATFLLGLGDALNSSASILGRTDVRTHNLQSYMNYLEGQKQSAENYDRLKASQDSESKRGKARFLIDQADRKQIKADEQAGREVLQKAALADKEDARKQREADMANEQAFQLKKQAEAQLFDEGIQKSRFRHEEGMAKLESRLKGGDQTAEKDLKNFSTGAQIVAGFQNGLPAGKDGSPAVAPLAERLKAGESAEDIRRELEDEMTQAGIFGAPRDLTRNYFNERILRVNRKLQQEAEQQPSPGQ